MFKIKVIDKKNNKKFHLIPEGSSIRIEDYNQSLPKSITLVNINNVKLNKQDSLITLMSDRDSPSGNRNVVKREFYLDIDPRDLIDKTPEERKNELYKQTFNKIGKVCRQIGCTFTITD